MKLIPVGKHLFAEVDDSDYAELSRVSWSVDTSGRHTLYARRNRRTASGELRNVKMHRAILGLSDPKVFVDHIDGNGLNNQRSNLRVCTDAQNKMNRGRNRHGKAPYKGVSLHSSGLWRARHKSTLLGYFKDPVQAAIAYDREALRVDGEFAFLNFPMGQISQIKLDELKRQLDKAGHKAYAVIFEADGLGTGADVDLDLLRDLVALADVGADNPEEVFKKGYREGWDDCQSSAESEIVFGCPTENAAWKAYKTRR